MAKSRTSAELHPDGFRIVDVVAGGSTDVRVRTYATALETLGDPGASTESLARLRKEHKLSRGVWLTVWGLRTVHQLLRLPPAGPDALESIARREARKELAPLEADGRAATVAIVQGDDVEVGPHRKREVALIAVSTDEVNQRIQPFIDAGFTIQGVVTPALALASIARSASIGGTSNEGRAVAYVAIIRTATCLAIIRNGVLLFAREMSWGHGTGNLERGTAEGEPGLGIDSRLAAELKRSILFFKQTFRASVEAVVLCGDMQNLRSLTAPLGDALGLPIEPLDSLVGIDAASVPEPSDQFRRDVAALRMAIATGADTAPVANLLSKVILEKREGRRLAVRFAAAAAAGLLLVAAWYGMARQTAASHADERRAVERELAILEPDAARHASLQQALTTTTVRRAALTAFDSQGPRLARFLEALAASTPDEVTLDAVSVRADGPFWQATVRGLATSADAAAAQRSVNTLVGALSDSPFAGTAVRPPSRRVVSSRSFSGSATSDAGTEGTQAPRIPAGMTGVEFSMQFRIAK